MANFFNEEMSDRDMIKEWFNELAVTPDNNKKVSLFLKIQEYLLHKAPDLLPEFMQDLLDLTTSRNTDIKKGLITCLEELCKISETYLTKIMLHLHMLLCDESVVVQKRVIQGTITLYKKMLIWVCKLPNVTSDVETAWAQLTAIKKEIVNMIDSDNDGIRTSTAKFLESVILLQSYPDPNDSKPNEFSLEDVPLTLKIARRRKLEEEANNFFSILLKFTGSQHISSANLFACIGALTNIGKNRPEFMGSVVSALESLKANMPPTLSTTQVNSITKKLKSEMIGLIKHPASYEFTEKISFLLSQLGLLPQELAKLLPKVDERRRYIKRALSQDASQPNAKRLKMDNEKDLYERQRQAIEMNEKFVMDNLNKTVCVQLLLHNFYKLPDVMPSKFAIDYKDTLQLGHVGDVKVLAKIIAEQFVENGVGPGNKFIGKTALIVKDQQREERNDSKVQDTNETEDKDKRKERQRVSKIKTLKLAEVTRPLQKGQSETLLLGAVKRLLVADKRCSAPLKQKIITTVAANFNSAVRDSVLEFLVRDLKNNIDLALSWLYEEYSIVQGFSRVPELRRSDGRLDKNYNTLLNAFADAAKHDPTLLSRIMLESPVVTEDVLNKFTEISHSETNCNWAIGLLKDMIVRRPTRRTLFLESLLRHAAHESTVVRDCAVTHVLELYERSELTKEINDFVIKQLDYLKHQTPPGELFGNGYGRHTKSESWTENLVRACVQVYIALLPINETLIHELAKVYVASTADVKRIILRLLEGPVKTMGMESQELLRLVEECPKGTEPLITRLIHILTDKGLPTPQLVQKVRDLYNTRISDVRFLIPVLNGLTKKEIITALPKLIKLNPVVVKEVFNRLLGIHGESSITPTELLVALHLIDSSKADIKTVMKATSMCLGEKQIFTQEVLAVVLQQLMDQPHLPTLLMRTVIQALSSYPRLSGFVMNILQRLILKQVWKNKIVWEGFVKCCQRTQPQSFSVLMQLPSAQLIEALEMSSDLKEPLKEHIQNLTENQRAHVPSSVQEILLGPTPKVPLIEPPMIKHSEAIMSEPLPPGME